MSARTEPPGLGDRAVTSMGWVALGKWTNRFFGLVVFAVLGRLLDPTDIGLAALATVFTSILTVLADQGFSSALVQKRTVDDEDRDTAFWTAMAAAVALTALIEVLAPLAAHLLGEPQLSGVLRALAPLLILSALSGTTEALLERDFGFKQLSLRTLVSSFSGGAVGVTAAALGAGVWSLVAQYLTTSAVIVVVLWRTTTWRPGRRVSRRSLRELRPVGLSVLSIQILAFVNQQGDKLLVGAFLGPRDLGFYFIGQRIIAMLLDIQTSVIEAVSLTTLSKLQDNKRRLARAFYRLTGAAAALGIMTFALLAATAPVVLPLLFGDQWRPAVPIMQIFCVVGCVNAIQVFDRNALIAVGAARAAFVITLVQTVVGLAAVAAVLPFGVLAVAIATTARQYVVWPLRLRALRRHLHIQIRTYLRRWVGPMIAGLVVFGLAEVVSTVWTGGGHVIGQVAYVVVVGLVGACAYVAILRFTGRATFDELRELIVRVVSRRSSGRQP